MERSVVAGVVLAAVGVAVASSPLLVYDDLGQRYHVSVPDTAADSVPPGADVVDYAALSGTERELFDPPPNPAIVDGNTPIATATFTTAEWRRADRLRTHDYVRYRGGYYPVDVDRYVGRTRWVSDEFVLTWFLPVVPVALGSGFAALGAAFLVVGAPRPLTPRRAAAVTAVVGLALAAFSRFLGLTYTFRVDSADLGVAALMVFVPSLGAVSLVVLGSAVAHGDRRWAGGALLALSSAVVTGGGIGWSLWSHDLLPPPITLLAVGVSLVFVVVMGTPFALSGYFLTPGPGEAG